MRGVVRVWFFKVQPVERLGGGYEEFAAYRVNGDSTSKARSVWG